MTNSRELDRIKDSLRRLYGNPLFLGRNYYALYSRLRGCGDSIEYSEKSLRQMSDTVLKIRDLYQSSEKKIVGESTGSKATYFDFKKLILDVIGKGGIIGGVVSTIGKVVTGKWDKNTVKDIAGGALGLLGGLAGKFSGGTNVKWKDALFGLSSGLKDIDTTSAWSAFKSSIGKSAGDYIFKGNGWDKVKVATKWGAAALSGIFNGIENIEEFKGQSGKGLRIVGETVIETVTDVAVGWGATALVTAGAAALTSAGVIAGAPAIAIGAGAAAVTWAANGICKWATGGKDLGEVAADLVCDGVEKVGGFLESVTEKTQNLLSDAGNAIAGVFHSTGKWAKSLFSW